MKLFEISNECCGESHVHVFCIAITKEIAIDMVREKFKKEAEKGKYPSNYYEQLTAELLCADISYGFCTEIYD